MLRKTVQKYELLNWLHAMGPWDVIAHFTWRPKVCEYPDHTEKLVGVSEWSAARGLEQFMKGLPAVSYFYSVEKNPSSDGHHVHALWGDCNGVFRKEQWARWLKLHGRARIEPVRCEADVEDYASKYVMKLPCWWNVHLRWHRVQALNNSPFVLASNCNTVCPG